MFPHIIVILLACAEEHRIGDVISTITSVFQNVLVVDDYSVDKIILLAFANGVKVIKNSFQKEYLGAKNTGFRKDDIYWFFTANADGDNN